ncbi:MAG: GNAT family N-acetyltransferase [Sphingopyxis sp.]|nr:GNAT family N-acetyltransferase [Sphingopyxis sp.]
MLANSPAGSCHFLDFDGLRAGDVTFWSIHGDGELAGCGALRMLGGDHGEIKSMRTADAFLRQGVAARMLDHIIQESHRRGLRRLSLETGSSPAFGPALALYARYGFEDCAPFADYRPDPFSRFMTRAL